jgi:hypothetical protein
MKRIMIGDCKAEWEAFLREAQEGGKVSAESIGDIDFAGLQLLAMEARVASDLGLAFEPVFEDKAAEMAERMRFKEAIQAAKGASR